MARKSIATKNRVTRVAHATQPKRAYVKQSDVPLTSLEYALRMPQAIVDHYAGKPATPLQVAKALEMDPKGSQIRVLSGAAMAFGLIEGGAQASAISVTSLARRILRPMSEGEDLQAIDSASTNLNFRDAPSCWCDASNRHEIAVARSAA